MTSRRLGLIGALAAGLILSAGTAVAAGGGAAPDLTFTAVGTGDTTGVAQSAAAAAVAAEKDTFVQRTGAACGATLWCVYCGAPTLSASAVYVYGFATGDTQFGCRERCPQRRDQQRGHLPAGYGRGLHALPSSGFRANLATDAGLGRRRRVPGQLPGGLVGPPANVSCHVTYIPDNWPGGFTANVTMAKTGSSTIDGWTLSFTFPGDQHITSAWNATVTQLGASVMAANLSYDAVIAPGASQSFGVQGTWSGSDTSPTGFTVNGASCARPVGTHGTQPAYMRYRP